MKRFKISFLSLLGCLLLITSCQKDNSIWQYEGWKNTNDKYFAAMKDSTDYTLYTIPANRGGGSYYYKVTVKGDSTSASPLYTDEVKVQYRGKLVNGTVFDQSYTGLTPPTDIATARTFTAGGVVRGWTENLMQMKVGEVRKIVLSQELGYGSTGSYPAILPYSVTVWNVRLVK